MTPKPGQFLAVHSDNFIGESIQFFETIQDIRESDFNKHKFLVNHIAEIINDEYGNLCIYEMVAEGCIGTKWENTDYFRNEKQFLVCELVDPFTEFELECYSIEVRKDKGKRYDYLGILHQIVYTITGLWLGKTGKDARKRFYCSEQAATRINEQKPKMFKEPWKVNPQMFIENKGIKILGANFKQIL